MRKATFFLSILAVGLFFIILALPSAAQEKLRPKGIKRPTPPPPQQQMEDKKAPEQPLVPQGKEADLTVFFTGDVIGYIEECG